MCGSREWGEYCQWDWFVNSISVVMPLYNKAETVERSLMSVLAQTVRPLEVIVVDDGSSDESATIVRSLCEEHVRIVTQENSGVSAARNAGVRESRGDFICFLDADDVWDEGFLAEMSGCIRQYPEAGLVSCRHRVFDGERVKESECARLCKQEDGVEQRLVVRRVFEVYPSTQIMNSSKVCVSRRVLEEIGGFPDGEVRGEDIVTWLRVADRMPVVFSCRTLVTLYRSQKEFVSGGVRYRAVPAHVRLIGGGLEEFRPESRKAVKRAIERNAVVQAASSVMNGERLTAMRIGALLLRRGLVRGVVVLAIALVPATILKAYKRRR